MRRHLVLLAAASAMLMSCGGDDDDDGGGEAAGEYCDALAAVKSASDESAPVTEGGDATPEQLEEAFNALEATFADWEAAAPEEISADIDVTTGALRGLNDALAEVDYDLFQVDEQTLSELSNPEVEEAGARVDAYGERECGITLEASDG